MNVSQHVWSTLWAVSQNAAVANSRAAGITGDNPVAIEGYYTGAIVAVTITTGSAATTLIALRIYGSDNVNGFPPAGDPNNEALATWTPGAVQAINTGILRTFQIKSRDAGGAGAAFSAPIIPKFLLLEYSTGVGGDTLAFNVDMTALGFVPDGTA